MSLVSRRRPRPLRALQVEVTSRCSRRCMLCPRFALSDRWRESDLSAEAWSAIRPALGQASHVHLQGWGEPLLHPELPAMAEAAKSAGCAIGLTTNGDLLPGASPWIRELSVDLVTVSVAGSGRRQPELRGGAPLAAVLAAAEELARSGPRHRRPRLQLSFLLTEAAACDLPEVVTAAAAAGFDEVFATHLDCTPSRDLLDRAAFENGGLRPGAEAALVAAAAAARRARISFRPPAHRPQDLLTCALDPCRFVFVGSDGRVGPCVYALLPITGPIPRWTLTGRVEVEPVVYGTLPDQDLATILAGAARSRLTAPFAARLAAEDAFLEQLDGGLGSIALERLERADRRRVTTLDRHPFPSGCQGCFKTVGW